jgi:hypothetical protein
MSLVAEASIAQAEEDEYGYIDEIQEDGTTVTHKVDKSFMDLTDKQNLSFRSVLEVTRRADPVLTEFSMRLLSSDTRYRVSLQMNEMMNGID